MAGFSTPATHPTGWRPAAAPSLPSRMLQLPSRIHTISAPPTAPAVPGTTKKRRHRNIACVSCNKQKKRCGEIRPCGRCIELGIVCQQPIKPEGYTYFTKKRRLSKTSTVPPSPPLFSDGHHSLLRATESHQQNDYQRQHLPSPSPSVSTVGTPQPSPTSISSYDDPASTIPTSTGKSSDTFEPDHLDSCIEPHSASLDRTPLATPTKGTPKLPPVWDMSCWDLPSLPTPLEEVPYDVAKNSKYTGAPLFGLEKPIYRSKLQDDFTISGGPMDLGDVGVGWMDDLEMQGTEGAHGVNAGVAASGVASGAGIAWDPDWLDEVDLSNNDLVLDDVDLSNLDFSCLDDDILVDSGMPQLFAQPNLPSQPPQQQSPPAPLSPPLPRSGAGQKAGIRLPSSGRPGCIG